MLPQYHDINLYLQIPDFKEAYDQFPDSDKDRWFKNMFMNVYDNVVMTWDSNDESSSSMQKRKGRRHTGPLIVTEYMIKSLCDEHNIKPGDEFDSVLDMQIKCNIKNASQISYWKRRGWVKNLM